MAIDLLLTKNPYKGFAGNWLERRGWDEGYACALEKMVGWLRDRHLQEMSIGFRFSGENAASELEGILKEAPEKKSTS